MDRSPRTMDFRDYCWWPPVYSSAMVLLMSSVPYPDRYYEPCECLALSVSSLEISSADQYHSCLLKTTRHLQTPEYHSEENPSEIPKGLMPLLPEGDTKLRWKSAYFFSDAPAEIERNKVIWIWPWKCWLIRIWALIPHLCPHGFHCSIEISSEYA